MENEQAQLAEIVESSARLRGMSPAELVALRAQCDEELRRRRQALSEQLADVERAVRGAPTRKKRSDAGKPRRSQRPVEADHE